MFICSLSAKAQRDSLADIYTLERKVRSGDKNALLKLSSYFSDTTHVTDYLGYHPFLTTKAYVAARIFEENTFFLPTEISDSDLTLMEKEVQQLKNKIYFDTTINAFLITPLEQRQSKFVLRSASNYEMHKLFLNKDTLINNSWTSTPRFEKLLNEHDNRILAIVADRMIKNHDRLNEYDSHPEKYTDLLTLLTGISVGIPISDSITAFHLDNYYYSNYSDEIKFNYALYWLSHYKDYSWSDSLGRFKNNAAYVENSPNPYDLYLQMEDTDKRIAIAAFEKLFDFDTKTIENLNLEFQNNSYRSYWDYLIPARKLHFYCVQNNFNDKDTAIIARLDFLSNYYLPYCKRYTTENVLINTLTLNNVSTVELWALEHAASLDYLNSISRIIDKFYSNHWKELIGDKRYLKLYLKTTSALWFNHSGSCGNYLGKFGESTAVNTQLLTPILQETKDEDIKHAIIELLNGDYWERVNAKKEEVLSFRAKKISDTSSPWPENMRHAPVISNFEDSLKTLLKYNLAIDSVKEHYLKILALATYPQLGTALQYSLKIKTSGVYGEPDSLSYANSLLLEAFDIPFPFPMLRSMEELKVFLKNYHQFNEMELYQFYLKEDCINIYTKKGALDFQQIYDILKFDYSPFYFNESYSRSEGIYAITKILEYHFHTTLGLPLKAENSDGFFIVSNFILERREKWMEYLLEHHLVKLPKNDTYSFIDSQS